MRRTRCSARRSRSKISSASKRCCAAPIRSSQKPIGFGGLKPPKWPSQIFPDDPAWKIDPARVSKGRAIYAEICAECHLGPVNDPRVRHSNIRTRVSGPPEQWDARGAVLNPVQKGVAGMGTDRAQADVLALRSVQVPGFLDLRARARPRQSVGLHRSARALLDRDAVLDRVDDRGRPHQPEMDGRSRRSDADRAGPLGIAKELSQSPCPAESEERRFRARNLLPRAPLERRLGDRAVSP